MKQKQFNYLGIAYTLLIVLYPILNRYASFIPVITISEFLLLVLVIIYLITNKFKVSFHRPTMLFASVLLICALYFLFIQRSDNSFDTVGTILRLLFIYLSFSLLNKGLFYSYIGVKYLNVVSVIVCFYAFVQMIAATRGIYLTTYIPFLRVMSTNVDSQILINASYGLTFRPRSILNEPAHLATYCILPLFINLFGKQLKHKNIFVAIINTVCCVISLSTTGIFIAIFVWFLFLFKDSNVSKTKIALLLLFPLILTLTYVSGTFDFIIRRSFGGSISIDTIMNSNRFESIKFALESLKKTDTALFGNGLSSNGNYLPTFPRALYGLGLLGLVTILIMIICIFKKSNHRNKFLTVVFVVLNLGTEALFGSFAPYYLAFISNNEKV